jgi:hypothetical protein
VATLNDIAKKVTSLAQLNLTRGKTKAYKTGNLYNKVGSYNTPNRVLGTTKLGKKRLSKDKTSYGIELNLTYNPPGAEYGKFVEEGTVNMDARPFAQEAIDSPIIQSMIAEYVGDIVEQDVIADIQSELDLFDDVE